MPRERTWIAQTGGFGSISTTVQSAQLLPVTVPQGSTLQRIVGWASWTFYGDTSSPRTRAAGIGIRLDNLSVAPTVSNANAGPEIWPWFRRVAVSRTIQAASATELRYGFFEHPIESQGARVLPTSPGQLRISVVADTAHASDNILGVNWWTRCLILLPDE